jgi:hypothetical protein
MCAVFQQPLDDLALASGCGHEEASEPPLVNRIDTRATAMKPVELSE